MVRFSIKKTKPMSECSVGRLPLGTFARIFATWDFNLPHTQLSTQKNIFYANFYAAELIMEKKLRILTFCEQ